jgi:uncharacterized protein (TIGR03435 family)
VALSLTAAVSAQFGGFEIASVKPSNPRSTGPVGLVVPALGRVTATNATLRRLVYAAYRLSPLQVVGGPAWQNTTRFDIDAKAVDSSVTADQILDLLKTLLVDRFKLKAHTETREIPLYALVVARNDGKTGVKLRPNASACPDVKVLEQQRYEAMAKGGLSALQPKPGETGTCSITLLPSTSAPGSIGIHAAGQTMRSLSSALTLVLGREVADKTGLTGLYDFDLVVDIQTLMRLSADLNGNAAALSPGVPEVPALMTQLQEDLGLKLDSQRGPGEVLVIDSAELPMPD